MNKDNIPENTENTESLENTAAEETAAVQEVADAAETSAVAQDTEEVKETETQEETSSPADETEEKETKKRKEKRSRASSRKFRFGAMSTALTVVVIVAVVLINVVVGILADRYPLNLDLTKDGDYTLSQEAVDVIKSVDKEVEIVVFAPESLFENYGSQYAGLNTITRQYHEALVQAQALSGGKIKVTYQDPTDPTIESKYGEYDLEYADTLLLCGNASKSFAFADMYTADVQDYYSGSYTFTSKVEQTLASSLNAVAGNQSLVMTMFTGHGEDTTTQQGITDLFELNGYTVKSMNLASEEEIDENTSIAVIPAPSKDYSEEEIKRLREWMDNNGKMGRNLMVVVNYSADCPNLYEFLEENYGVTVTNNLVAETDSSKQLRNPFFASVYNSLVDVESTDLTGDLGGSSVILGPTRQLLTAHGSDPETESTLNIPILTYTDTAKIIDMDAANGEDAENALQAADSYPISGMVYARKWTVDNSGDTSVEIENNVLVCGGMNLFNSSYLKSANYANEDLALETVNTICGNEDSVKISSKVLSPDTLEFTEKTANVMSIVFVVGLPAAALIICLVVFLRRRHL